MRGRLLFLFLFCTNYTNAQLVINEVSQGRFSREYVELLVVGDVTCPSTCVDIRGWIIDDNNGFFASGSGTGIAAGHIRFSYALQWSCITPGTLIVVYNEDDPNLTLPPIDETDANSDCVYVIPYGSTTLETNQNIPNVNDSSYGGPYTPGGSQNEMILRNLGDSYQVIDPADLTQPFHAVSWGNNNMNTIIAFPNNGSAVSVYYMDNTVDDDPYNNNNWIEGLVDDGGMPPVNLDQTPGAPNSPANATWINTLNAGCVLNSFADAGVDVSYCEGESTTTTLTAAGGVSYEWSTTETTTSISVTPAITTTYTVTVTSAASCTNLDEVTIFVNPVPNPMIDVSGSLCGNNPTVSLDAGTGYSYEWSTTETSQNISVSTANTYTVTVTDGNNCTASTSSTINNVSLIPDFIRN